ncbi:MAG: hypothetical protein ACM3SO_24490 [Betaproteobacteria bacterium]
MLLLLLAAGATRASAEEGVVIDAVTGAPLSGVFVIARWHGEAFRPVEPSGGCYRVQLARSGADGRFHVDFISGNFNPLLTDRRRSIVLFKPGYEVKIFGRTFEERQALRPFAGTFAQRMEQYSRVWGRDCPEARPTLRPVLEAIRAEADVLARTPEDSERVAGFQRELDTDSMGYDAALDRYLDTVQRTRRQAGTK